MARATSACEACFLRRVGAGPVFPVASGIEWGYTEDVRRGHGGAARKSHEPVLEDLEKVGTSVMALMGITNSNVGLAGVGSAMALLLLAWALLTLLFLCMSFIMVRTARRIRRAVLRRRAHPTPVEDVWVMHKLPDEAANP